MMNQRGLVGIKLKVFLFPAGLWELYPEKNLSDCFSPQEMRWDVS